MLFYSVLLVLRPILLAVVSRGDLRQQKGNAIKEPMNKEKLLELVEALREAGQQKHHAVYDEGDDFPALGDETKSCYCGLRKHNAAVDAAAKALVAEIELLPDIACRKCRRTSCPHHGDFPRFAGPEHGCAAYQGGPA